MARRWSVQDTDGYIAGFTDDDDADVPTGYTATTIADDATGVPAEGVTTGSTWDVATSTYTARGGVGIDSEFDTSTELGRKQTAADALHQALKGMTDDIHAIRHEKPQQDVQRTEQFIAMAHWANYVAAGLGVTIDQYELWAAKMADWPLHVSNAQEFYQSVHGLMDR